MAINLTKEDILDEQHWRFPDYRQRITTKNWKALLMNNDDGIIFHGRVMKLVGSSLGHGVVEVSKAELTRGEP